MKYADYERRLVSFIIDVAICLVTTIILLSILGVIIDALTLNFAIKNFIPFASFVIFVYLLFSYRLFKGNTIGGYICNVRIVNKDGSNLRLKTSFVRALLLCILLLSIYNIFYMFLLRTQISFFDESTDTRAIQRVPVNDEYDPHTSN